jgi:hypothetical protein
VTLGLDTPPVGRDLHAAVEAAAGAGHAVDLAEHLYVTWYLGLVAGGPDALAGPRSPASENLLDALRAADAATGRWEDGWSVAAISSKGRVGVVREGRRRVLHRVDVLPVAGPCLPPVPGSAVRVTARRDTADAGGFWFTFGGDWDEAARPVGVVRYYWNAPAPALPALVRALTSALQAAGASYGLKALSVPGAMRPDSAVLYVRRADVAALRPALMAVHGRVAGLLGERTPPLALRLRPGLSVADDPETGESFGQHRCRLLAAGLERACTVGAAVAGLVAAGIDPARPHLNPGASEDDAWPPG